MGKDELPPPKFGSLENLSFKIPRMPGYFKGLNTGLTMREVWWALFRENTRRYMERKKKGTPRPRTDNEISEFIRNEFRHEGFDKNPARWRKVAMARYDYNHGTLWPKHVLKPKFKSYRHSYTGKIIGAKEFDYTEPRGETRLR